MTENNQLFDFVKEYTIPELEKLIRQIQITGIDSKTKKEICMVLNILINDLSGFFPE